MRFAASTLEYLLCKHETPFSKAEPDFEGSLIILEGKGGRNKLPTSLHVTTHEPSSTPGTNSLSAGPLQKDTNSAQDR